MPGKSERRLAAAIFVTAIMPLVAAIFLADSMFSRAAAVWFNPEVGQQLDRGLSLYKDYVTAIKADMRHQTDALAADEALGEAARAGDTARASARLDALFPRFPELVAIEVSGESGPLAKRDRGSRVDEKSERGLSVTRPVGSAGPLTLTATFAVDRKRLDELESSGDVVAKYHQIEASRADLYGGYVRAFALLLSLTIALTLVSGIVLARGVTTRINRLAVGARRMKVGPHLCREALQLGDGSRTVNVDTGQQNPLFLRNQQPRELRRRRRLTGALQARQQDHDRCLMAQVQPLTGLSHRLDEFIVENLDEDLTWREALLHLRAQGAHLHRIDEGLHDRNRHVGLDQRHTHLTQGIRNVVLGQAAAPGQGIDGAGQALGQTIKHGISFVATDYTPLAGRASRAAVAVQSSGCISGTHP